MYLCTVVYGYGNYAYKYKYVHKINIHILERILEQATCIHALENEYLCSDDMVILLGSALASWRQCKHDILIPVGYRRTYLIDTHGA